MQPKIVIHCADLHINKLKRHEEYAEQFTKFIERIKEITKPYKKEEIRIVIAGDLFQSKNSISNELFTFTSLFLRQLEEIATVIIIAGNHDLVVNNTDRTDTMTALFQTADFTNCKFLDMMLGYESGCVVDDDIIWAVYSIYDDYLRPNIEEVRQEHPDKKIIGLYHGMVIGSTLPNGYLIDEGADDETFKGCDCVIAGHIHKYQVIRKKGVEIVYPSSLIQQTFGETVTQHGFEVWNLEDMTHHFEELPTDYGLYSVYIDQESDIDKDIEKLGNL